MTDLFPGWKENHPPIPVSQQRIEKMIRAYGPGPADRICRDCENLIADGQHARTYYKCRIAGISHGPATDWKLKFKACGKFVERKP